MEKEFSRENQVALKTSRDLDPLLDRIGDARIVLLGEASHGTHEYYTWRTSISKRLITEKDFNFIAVEGDWPDCYRINRYIKGFDDRKKTPTEMLSQFKRWPTWMWANWEIAALVSWLKKHNEKNTTSKCGFYGLDVYSLWESMETLLEYLKKTDPSAARIAEKALDCFAGYNKDEQRYAVNSLHASCRDEVTQLLREIRLKATRYDHDPEAEINTIQNASVAVEAEKYYSNMMSFDNQTWNIRDSHMMATLNRLLEFHGKNSKAIVWEHNTHVGDARYTDMKRAGMHNVGQLAREEYGDRCVIVGFGSYSGSVIAGDAWGAEMVAMMVPEAEPGSVEAQLHNQASHDRMLLFEKNGSTGEFASPLPHRAIGVVYDPSHERHNYVPTVLSKRYDAFIYLDKTRALHPLHPEVDHRKVPDTFPFEF